jgi:aspartate racemase
MSGRKLGVLGGLGPLASVEFLRTVYEQSAGRSEQEMPHVVLVSDPTTPDRTLELLKDPASPALLAAFERGLTSLLRLDVDEIVVCCVTIHALLPAVRPELRSKVVSLIDIAVDAAMRSRERFLLVGTLGTSRLRIFESHAGWPRIADRVVLPEARDAERIHDWIYRLKAGDDVRTIAAALETFCSDQGLGGFIAGCTEMHLVSRCLGRLSSRISAIDPLHLVATRWAAATSAAPPRSAPPA